MSSSNFAPNAKTGKLLSLEEDLHFAAAKFGLNLKSSPTDLGARLELLAPEKAAAIANNMSVLIDALNTCFEEDIDPWDDREFFTMSMRKMGLTYPKDFLEKVTRDDLIEGYDMNRLQTFRNMRFMELSGYSLLEILSTEWTTLYSRPRAAQNKMIAFCEEILWSENRTIPFEVPVHCIRELMSKDKQVLEVKFKYLTPLFTGPNQPYGMLGTCAAEILPEVAAQSEVTYI